MKISEEEYKLAKEAHVANCTGGSIHEINMICASIVGSHMLWTSLVRSNVVKKDSFIPEFLIYVVPVLACLTIASDYASWITIGMATSSLFFYSSSAATTTTQRVTKTKSEYKPYLTVYRAGTMILTCIAILAVDFQFFPRRFAKVETFGTSLMDIGVGSFVFSSGVVASRAYIHQGSTTLNIRQSLLKSLRSAFPILVLGFARLFLTKSVNYQEHNSEYGLHWNFFFTLGFLPPFVTLLGFLRSRWLSFSMLGLLVACGYETALLGYGLQDWILNAPRVDLISANKEGICSFAGYLSIFLFGLECGSMIFKKDESKNRNRQYVLLIRLFIFSSAMWIAFGIWNYFYFSPEAYVSRRLANLPYIFWVISFNLSLLSLLVLVELQIGLENRGPPMLDAINTNGLFTFLLANVLTGTINLSMRTLYANTLTSSLVNILYMLIVTFVPWIMWRRYKIRVKF
ncbi:MAG: GPI-anchored wall transfer protein [Benjaminiella poitrasii]|nr:MAG: GPI-anchored wall transfer protein [Benjaminiella poitrasii]